MAPKRKTKPKPVTRPRGAATCLCPKCKSVSRVLRTVRAPTGVIMRERQCVAHATHRFNTEEKPT